MADVIVSGEIDGRNDAEFRAVLSCLRSGPSGSIRGKLDATINRREEDYSFRSNNPTRIVARRSGRTRYVYAVFRNATVINHTRNYTITGATIILTVRQTSTGRRTANLSISRSGRTTLRSSGRLEDSRISVSRPVSCRD
jgi:hypothetical protein